MTTLAIARTWDGQQLRPEESCSVDVTPGPTGCAIAVDAPFHDDPPPPGPAGWHDGLWAFEVVEIFIAAAEEEPAGWRYTEFEISPHGHHLALRFVGVRRRAATIEGLAPRCVITGQRWRGSVVLPWEVLPQRPWRVNAFAQHGRGARRRYLAATPLPRAAPDFHQPHRFPRFEL